MLIVSAMSGIATELRLLLMMDFGSYKVGLRPRTCNKIVNAFAPFGCKLSSDKRYSYHLGVCISVWLRN